MGFVGLSLAHTKVQFATPADQAGMYASLVSEASIGVPATPPPMAPSALDKLNDALEQPAEINQARAPSSNVDQLLTQMDTSTANASTPHTSAAASPSSSTSRSSVALESAENPWAKASSNQINPRFTQKLWAALKPCWKGDYGGTTSNIRVVLDGVGRVTAMTLLDDADAPARARAQLVAEALVACEPYRLGEAGAFLVRAPA